MVSGDRLFKPLGVIGALLIGVGGWLGWQDYGNRRGVTVELPGLADLLVETDVEHSAAFTLRNHTFRPARLVSGEPG